MLSEIRSRGRRGLLDRCDRRFSAFSSGLHSQLAVVSLFNVPNIVALDDGRRRSRLASLRISVVAFGSLSSPLFVRLPDGTI